LIDKFLEKDISVSAGTDLEEHIREYLQNEHIKPDQAADIGRQFEEARWRFYPAHFEFDVSHNYDKKRILPFLKRVPIGEGEGKGGTANLWNISVPEEFVGSKLRRKVASSKFTDEDSGVVVSIHLCIGSASMPSHPLTLLPVLRVRFENLQTWKRRTVQN
jgi:hypothetical protein